jgi:hypothetical protein
MDDRRDLRRFDTRFAPTELAANAEPDSRAHDRDANEPSETRAAGPARCRRGAVGRSAAARAVFRACGQLYAALTAIHSLALLYDRARRPSRIVVAIERRTHLTMYPRPPMHEVNICAHVSLDVA